MKKELKITMGIGSKQYMKIQGELDKRFFPLCLLRFGFMESWQESPVTTVEWEEFRNSVYPDYYDNINIPVISPLDFSRWCCEQRKAKEKAE